MSVCQYPASAAFSPDTRATEIASVLVISFTCRTAAPIPEEPEAVTDFLLVISRREVVIKKTGKYVLCVEINGIKGNITLLVK